MAIEFDSLPHLWAALADALSGRTSVVVDPPLLTSEWFAAPTAALAAGDLVVTMTGPGGPYELTCTAPAATLAGVRTFTNDENSRRALVVSFTPGGSDIRDRVEWAGIARQRINSVLWPALYSSSPPSPNPFLLTLPAKVGTANVETYYWFWRFASTGPTWHGASGLEYSVVDTVLDFLVASYVTKEGAGLATPVDPDGQEPLASMAQWPGSGASVGAADALAVRLLAEAINAAGSEAGQVTQHGGRPLLSVGGPAASELPPWDGTADVALRSLALACQGFFAQGLVLPLRGGRRAVLSAGALL